jgi:GT2 family glycosyltransferase
MLMNSTNLPLVYVIVLSWNNCSETINCLDSVNKLSYPNKRILLVDNGSQDGTPQTVAAIFPNIEIIVNDENLGFAAGCNVGLRYALENGAEFVFLLNNDTEVSSDALDHLIAAMGPGIGMAAPKIYYAHASQPIIWSIGGKCHPVTLEKIGDARGQIDRGQWNQVLERDYLVGCAVLISRKLLETVGLFDESFFMYYEDSDLSLRARRQGFKLLFVPNAHVWHKVALSSGGSDTPNERYWMARSSILFFYKHVKGLRWLVIVPYRVGSAIKTLIRLLWRKRWDAALAYCWGLRDGLIDVWRRVSQCTS